LLDGIERCILLRSDLGELQIQIRVQAFLEELLFNCRLEACLFETGLGIGCFGFGLEHAALKLDLGIFKISLGGFELGVRRKGRLFDAGSLNTRMMLSGSTVHPDVRRCDPHDPRCARDPADVLGTSVPRP